MIYLASILSDEYGDTKNYQFNNSLVIDFTY
jgi:hypothetical protein